MYIVVQPGFRQRWELRLGVLSAFIVTLALLTLPASPAQAVVSPVLGTYSGAILEPAGPDYVRHTDVDATVAALERGNVNTYAYMIFGYGEANTAPSTLKDSAAADVTQAQWDDLPAFLTASAAAGIEVWVYLVPPSESFAGGASVPVPSRVSTYAPFGWDYVLWASKIGELAAVHTNLRAIAMDDFGGNTQEWGHAYSFRFTPTNVAAMRSAARANASWIEFFPVLYYCQFSNNLAISSYYRSVVDGYVGVYNGTASCTGTPPANTTDASLADYYLRIQSSMTKCKTSGCLELGVPAATSTSTGAYSSVRQLVSVNPSGPYSLKFAAHDDFVGGSPGGYHKLQVLVDGAVVWEQDAANYHGWTDYTVDLTSALAGKSTAYLTLRLYEATGVAYFHVSAWFDSLVPAGFSISNPGFDTSLAGWTALESHALFDQKWVPSLKFYPMPYAAILADSEAPTTSAYTTAVTETALTLLNEGKGDGVLLYNMNLTGAPNGLGDPNTLDNIAVIFATFM